MVRAEGSPGEKVADFAEIQRSHIEAFRAAHADGERARVSQGLVVIPTDRATPDQRAKYQTYVENRTPRTAEPQGPGRMMFAPDLIGTSEQVAEALYADVAFREVREVVAERLGPALGWQPKASPAPPDDAPTTGSNRTTGSS
ncbi:MAG TPA: hypothetical protein VGL60_02190 [Acidimicrobiales bacterium]